MLSVPEAVAVGSFCTLLTSGSNMPGRRPSWTRPTLAARPLIVTVPRPVIGAAVWADFLTVSGLKGYKAMINAYVASTMVPASISGIEFRLMLNGNPLPACALAPGVELNREDPTVFPTVPRPFFLVVNENETFAIQVRNTSIFQRTVLCAAYGWYYDVVDSTVTLGGIEGLRDD